MNKPSLASNVSCERSNTRKWVPSSESAWIDIAGADGRTWSLQVIDLSVGGLSFGVDGTPLDGVLVPGMTVAGAMLHADRQEFSGILHIVHVTAGFATGVVCGGTFEPDPDSYQAYHAWIREWMGP